MKVILQKDNSIIEIMGVSNYELNDDGITIDYGYGVVRTYSSKEYDISLKPQWRNEEFLIPKGREHNAKA